MERSLLHLQAIKRDKRSAYLLIENAALYLEPVQGALAQLRPEIRLRNDNTIDTAYQAVRKNGNFIPGKVVGSSFQRRLKTQGGGT